MARRKAGGREPEVTARVVGGVGHQPQVGEVAAGLEGLHGLGIEHEIGRKHIACGQPEHRPQLRQRAGNAACGFQRPAKVQALVGV